MYYLTKTIIIYKMNNILKIVVDGKDSMELDSLTRDYKTDWIVNSNHGGTLRVLNADYKLIINLRKNENIEILSFLR